MVPVYRVERVSKVYRQGKVPALHEVSFAILPGEIFGLLGPNGAGKSTLVRMLVGLLRPSRGAISFYGQDLARSAARIPHRVGYFAQRAGALSAVPAGMAVALTGHIRGLLRHEADRQAAELLGYFGLAAKTRTPCGRLSGGEQRLVALATALIGHLPVLILDEPTNELDPENRVRVWELLLGRNRKDRTTIILVTHNVWEAERVIQRVGILHQGRMMAIGSVGELKAQVEKRVRIEVRLREEADEATWERLAADLGQRWLRLGRGHGAILVPADRAPAVVAHVLADGGTSLEDFRVLTPTLEDVYLQLGGRARLDGDLPAS